MFPLLRKTILEWNKKSACASKNVANLTLMYVAWKSPYIPVDCTPSTMKRRSYQERFNMTLGILTVTLLMISHFQTRSSPPHNHLPTFLFRISVNTLKHRLCELGKPATPYKKKTLLVSILLLCGDIESNPGPAQVYPCGLCDLPVTWAHQDGLCCDGCDIWHHRSCIELCSADYDLLVKHSHIPWLCCKCDRINISSFTSEPSN